MRKRYDYDKIQTEAVDSVRTVIKNSFTTSKSDAEVQIANSKYGM
ncbi:hypothetical protein [Anaerocolumna sp.]|nr:hypothetical protein [Anaerocolumna sp.]